MRQVFAYVNPGQGQEGLELAETLGGINLSYHRVKVVDGERDLLILEVENDKVDSLIEKLQGICELSATLLPEGVIALKPPRDAPADDVTDVTSKGPLQIFISGLQSIGSWKGFLGLAVAAGVVAWIGLYTNTVYLLVASMLIAPFAGPAMTLALGTARGDMSLIRRSLLRYSVSLGVGILTAGLLSLLMGQGIATVMMASISTISSVTTLLSLTAGAAGALSLCKSDRDSLVTAAGPGMLIAASLAPPASVAGMAVTIGEWDMLKNVLFLLINQLVCINIAGSVIFYIFGLRPEGVRFDRGIKSIRNISFVLSVIAAGGILFWQFSSSPSLQRSTRSRDVARVVKDYLNRSPLAHPVEVNVRFTRADIKDQNTILIDTFVQNNSDQDSSIVKKVLTKEIKEKISTKSFNVTPLVNVTVLESD